MGRGEAACITLASAHGWLIASDERHRAFRRALDELLGRERLLNTPGLLLLSIQRGLLSIEDADTIKALLEQRRFKMKFQSFRELFPGSSS